MVSIMCIAPNRFTLQLQLQLQYADLVNGLADQGIFQRGRAAGQSNAASSASSSSGMPSAAGQSETAD